MKRIMVFLCTALLAFPAFALDLQSARDQGLVGEKTSGYVAAVKSTPEVAALVKDVNARRSEEYAKIGAESKQSVDVVAKIAAEKIIQGLKSGQFYEGADGSWKKR